MRAAAIATTPEAILPLRVRYREEMHCQIVHDSIHRRAGWTSTYALRLDEVDVGFGTVAIGGPWTGKPTIIEFHVLPAYRHHAFLLFECLLEGSGARLMEIQSNDALLAAMLHTYARDVWSEKIVFQDGVTTALEANGARLLQVTPDAEVQAAIARGRAEPSGGSSWTARPWRQAASCSTTTCPMATSTWRLPSRSGAEVLAATWSRS